MREILAIGVALIILVIFIANAIRLARGREYPGDLDTGLETRVPGGGEQ